MRKLLAGLATIAVVAAGCGSDSHSSTTADAVRVGLLYPTAGPQQVGGTEEERGARLAIDWANNHGGILGRHIVADAAQIANAESVPAAMDDLQRRGVTIVLGSHGSAVSAAAAQAATRRRMTVWETGAVGELSGAVASGRNFFRLAPMGANLGRAGIAFVADELAPKLPSSDPQSLRYAVAWIDDAYGRAVGTGAAAAVTERGYTLAGVFPYEASTTDFAPLAQAIAATRPDVLFVSAYLDDGVALRKAMVAAHVPLLASIGTSSSYCHPAFGDALGDDAVGLFASDKPDAANVRAEALSKEGRAALTWARTHYESRYHEPMSAPALSGFSNAFAVLVHVAPAAATLDSKGLAAVAAAVKLPEGSLANGGGLDLAPAGADDAGENRAASGVIWEWVAPRTRAVVWPPAYATHHIAVHQLSQ